MEKGGREHDGEREEGESAESLLGGGGGGGGGGGTLQRRRSYKAVDVLRKSLPWMMHFFLLLLSLSILVLAKQSKRQCVSRRSVYFGAFQLSEEEFQNVNPTFVDGAVRLSERQGGGYMASLEVFHQLHCVNLVRQYTHRDYYQDKAISFEDPPDVLRTHVDHCLEILRQVVMCNSDLEVLTYNWVSIRTAPWPNFNVEHKCRNFDAVLDWALKHQAPSKGETWTHTAGSAILPTPP
ncbi:MAG: hypothetical protein Q9190_003889 [Brigantiaea leucoxantha]